MEKYEEFLKSAKKEIEVSDHLIYKTFSLIKDTKFLIAITEHIIDSSIYALKAILSYEKYWKRIGPYPDSILMQTKIYEERISKRYKLDPKYIRLIKSLLETRKYIKESPMMFKRKNKYILSSKNYKTKTLDFEKVKRYFNLVKKFINDVEKIINNGTERSQKKAQIGGLFA